MGNSTSEKIQEVKYCPATKLTKTCLPATLRQLSSSSQLLYRGRIKREEALARLRECCRHAQAEVASNSRNKIYQTWPKPFRRARMYRDLRWLLGYEEGSLEPKILYGEFNMTNQPTNLRANRAGPSSTPRCAFRDRSGRIAAATKRRECGTSI